MITTAAQPIQHVGDFYVPTFRLTLQNRAAPGEIVRDVMSVTFKDSLTDIDSFEFVVNNWDAETRDFKYADDTRFDPGTEVKLEMGYHGQGGLELMLTGEITSLRPSFPAAGAPTLTVSGLNLLHKFRGEQKSHTYLNKTDSEIAKAVGGRLGVKVKVDGANETRHPYMVQDNVYDIVFLMERARDNDYELVVLEGSPPTLHFGPSTGVGRPTYQLVYGRSLIELQPSLTTANQVGKVVVRGWDPIAKKKIEYEAGLGELATSGLGPGVTPGVQKSYEARKEIISTRIVESQAEARRLATETLQQIAKGLVTATGSTVGLPKLRAGNVIEIGGLGQRFSGRYYVTDTTHVMGESGYTTQFGCRREEVKGA